MGGDEDFSFAVAVEIGDDRGRETLAFELDWVLIGEMHPGLSEGKITLMLQISNPKTKTKLRKRETPIEWNEMKEGVDKRV